MIVDLKQTKFLVIGDRIYVVNPNMPVTYLRVLDSGTWSFELLDYRNLLLPEILDDQHP